nr:exocyst complex component SEC3A [Ipomoea batatas]GMC89425.1 exocyst complex component SEC3A [Ipomoea batatas]GMD09734.1 exocyst complex component SEC3A [Ipomoea batatas]GME07505.1 exocyst complex component SEC3A [Ipomoea batatas]
MQSVNNRKLIEDLDRLVEKFCIPAEHASYLTGDSFDEACMHRNVEACEWLTGAIVRLDSPNLDSTYSNMRAVKEKRAELRILKMNFARRATDFLNQYVHDWTQNNAGYQHYILPLKVGATPKFSQRTQLVTENYQVV